MANRRGKRGDRIEPKFGASDTALDLCLDASDRPAGPAKGGKRRAGPKNANGSASAPRKTASSGKTGSGNGSRKPPRAAAGRRRKRGRGQGGGRVTRLVKRGLYWGMVACIWGFIVVAGTLAYFAAQLPQSYDWEVPARPPNVKIVSAEGRLIANRGESGGEAVRLEQLPKYLPQAVIAIEDRRFRSHFGIDFIGLARAMVTNVTRGTLVQGGSTLTQQLAKNLFLTPERTINRKMQEVVLALWLEARFSKDEILEMYLNRVYFGAGAYGVDGAARRYFGKSARQVTLAEAATLAALLKAPSRYAPTRNPDLAEERAQLVLAAMNDAGFISAEDAKNAIASPALAVAGRSVDETNYVADWVMDLLPGYIGRIDEDIIVDTTIDWHLQQEAEKALDNALDKSGVKLGVSQGALVSLDTSGAVKALIGGRDYHKSQFNRAVSAERQPGSAFKPFVYLTALEQGLTPDTVRVDEPVSINGWKPKNYTKKYYGPVTLRKALAYSLNTVAAKLGEEVGPANVAATAKRLGITSTLKVNPSLSLGTSEVTPLEIASAYVPFSNGGWGVVPHVIRTVKTESGKVLFHRVINGPGQVIQPDKLREIDAMLAETLITGTGKKASLGDRPAGGKTGTSQDLRDAWFIGFTANYTTAVWLGNDDGSPTKGSTGGALSATIWHDFMAAAHENMPLVELPGIPVGGPVIVETPASAPPPRTVANGVYKEHGHRVPPPPSNRSFLDRLFGGG